MVFREYQIKYGDGRDHKSVEREYSGIKAEAFRRNLIDPKPKPKKKKRPQPPIKHPTNYKRVGLMGGRCSPR